MSVDPKVVGSNLSPPGVFSHDFQILFNLANNNKANKNKKECGGKKKWNY